MGRGDDNFLVLLLFDRTVICVSCVGTCMSMYVSYRVVCRARTNLHKLLYQKALHGLLPIGPDIENGMRAGFTRADDVAASVGLGVCGGGVRIKVYSVR